MTTNALIAVIAILVIANIYFAGLFGRERRRHTVSLGRLVMRDHVVNEMDQILVTMARRVDPWEMQAKLMDISGQQRPAMPRMVKTSLLYAALVMEETGEAYKHLARVLLERTNDQSSRPLDVIGMILRNASIQMEAESVVLRRQLAEVADDWDMDLTQQQAIDLLDDTTDITVVNSGFALALGLPGAAGYLDVAGSNHSKANPDTGVIDKDPSGKWIKGARYRAPDLARVLQVHSYLQGVANKANVTS